MLLKKLQQCMHTFCGRLDGGSRTWQLYAFFAWICLTLHAMFHLLLVHIVSHVSICTVQTGWGQFDCISFSFKHLTMWEDLRNPQRRSCDRTIIAFQFKLEAQRFQTIPEQLHTQTSQLNMRLKDRMLFYCTEHIYKEGKLPTTLSLNGNDIKKQL